MSALRMYLLPSSPLLFPPSGLPSLPFLLPLRQGLHTDQADLSLVILLSQPPRFWDYRCSLLRPATSAVLSGPHVESGPPLGNSPFIHPTLIGKALSLYWPPYSAMHKEIAVVGETNRQQSVYFSRFHLPLCQAEAGWPSPFSSCLTPHTLLISAAAPGWF